MQTLNGGDGTKLVMKRFYYLEDWPKIGIEICSQFVEESQLLQTLARPPYSLTHAVRLMMILQMFFSLFWQNPWLILLMVCLFKMEHKYTLSLSENLDLLYLSEFLFSASNGRYWSEDGGDMWYFQNCCLGLEARQPSVRAHNKHGWDRGLQYCKWIWSVQTSHEL